MSRNGKRELGTISYVKYGTEASDGRWFTVSLGIEFEGFHQGFGGLALDAEKYGPDYVADLCKTFNVKDYKKLAGKKCYALRLTDGWNETIEGLESVDTGLRFTHTEWRRKHWPDTPSPLEARKAEIRERAAALRRRADQAERELAEIDSDYNADLENI